MRVQAVRDPLPIVVIATLAFNALGLVISLVGKTPKEFGGVGDPDNVLGEFPAQGTLFAAPLAPLVVLIVATLFRQRGRWLGSVALLAVVVFGVLFIIGTLGEPMHPKASDPPLALIIVWRTVGIGLAVGLIGLAGLGLRQKLGSGG